VLFLGGPAALVLAYLLMGTVVYAVLVISNAIATASNSKITLGEMVSFLPISGAIFTLANRTLSPSLVWSYCTS